MQSLQLIPNMEAKSSTTKHLAQLDSGATLNPSREAARADTKQQSRTLVQGATRNTDIYKTILRTLLILDLVVFDKLHRISNISLICIHLRTSIDTLLDSATIPTDSMVPLVDQFHSQISSIFKHAQYFDLFDLQSLYNSLQSRIGAILLDNIDLDMDQFDTQFNDYINKILCCSESLVDYLHFEGEFATDLIKDHEDEKVRAYFLDRTFNSKSITNPKMTPANSINSQALILVQSERFISFHLSRWKEIGLLDKHIFKSAK